jgi:hypothetical protein
MAVEPGRLAGALLAPLDGLGTLLGLGLGLGLGLAGFDDREKGDDKDHQENCELRELHDCGRKEFFVGECRNGRRGVVDKGYREEEWSYERVGNARNCWKGLMCMEVREGEGCLQGREKSDKGKKRKKTNTSVILFMLENEGWLYRMNKIVMSRYRGRRSGRRKRNVI